MDTEFSTYNESSLHNSLKTYYCLQTNGKTEVSMDGHIYDIVSENGDIIEIQTKNISKLLKKCEDVLNLEKKIKIVHPLININTIVLTDQSGNLISKRKSPKKGNIYDILKELTGIYPILLNKNFTLEIVNISLIEHRVRTEAPEQSANKRRRFMKNWIKVNKSLDEIISVQQFKTKQDYLELLPHNLPEEFSTKDVKELLKAEKDLPSRTINNVNLLLWLLRKMEIIKQTKKQGNAYIYRIN